MDIFINGSSESSYPTLGKGYMVVSVLHANLIKGPT